MSPNEPFIPSGKAPAGPLDAAHLDDMHKQKIDMADAIFVVNKNGYVGESTRSEIAFAEALGKPVRYMENPIR